VAISLEVGVGLNPLLAPRCTQQMAHRLHPLLESSVLLTALSALAMTLYFNGSRGDDRASIEAAKTAQAH
jgi:NCS2 family nucleobase:cation symporter-2